MPKACILWNDGVQRAENVVCNVRIRIRIDQHTGSRVWDIGDHRAVGAEAECIRLAGGVLFRRVAEPGSLQLEGGFPQPPHAGIEA